MTLTSQAFANACDVFVRDVHHATHIAVVHTNRASLRIGEPYTELKSIIGNAPLIVLAADAKGAKNCIHARTPQARVELASLEPYTDETRQHLQSLTEANFLWSSYDRSEDETKEIASALEIAATSLAEYGDDFSIRLSTTIRFLAVAHEILRYRFDTADELLTKLPNTAQSGYLAHALPWLRARVQVALGTNLPHAAAELSKAAILALENNYQRDATLINALLAQVYLDQNLVEIGEATIKGAIKMAGEQEDLLATAYNNLGYVSVVKANLSETLEERQEHLHESVRQHSRALEFARKASPPQFQAITINNIAWSYEQLGNLALAKKFHRESFLVVEGKLSPKSKAVVEHNLGRIYLNLGDYVKAAENLNNALTAFQQGESSRLQNTQCLLGDLHDEIGEPKQALTHYEDCVNGADRFNDPWLAVLALAKKAHSLARLGDNHLAKDVVNQVRDRMQQLSFGHAGEFNSQSKTNSMLAVTAVLLSDNTSASYHAHQARATLEKVLNPTLKVDVYRDLLEVAIAVADFDSANLYVDLALKLVEETYSVLEPERLAPSWSAKTHRIIDLVTNFYLAREQPRRLIEILERTRALGLRNSSRAELIETDSTEVRINALSELADDRASQQDQSAVLSHLAAHELFLATSPWKLNHSPLPRREVEEIQAAIGPDTIAIYLLSTEGTDIALLLTLDSVKYVSWETQSRTKTVTELADQLSAGLNIDQDLEGKRQLFFVMGGRFTKVPLALLKTASGAYLSDVVPVAAIPSISTLLDNEVRESAPPALQLVVLADPILHKTEPEPANSDAWREWSKTLAPLPWTRHEAMVIRSAYGLTQVSTYLGDAATRDNLFDESSRSARVLHIASHGYFRDEDPDMVGIIVSPTPDTGGKGGFVTLTEVMRHRFANELVIVSGCDTSRGADNPGEGQISVSRAFLSRGAKHAIGTLWPVSDRASAEFMRIFHEELHKQGRIRIALANAQRRMRLTPGFSDPIYWAGYRLESRQFSDQIGLHR